MGLFKRSKEAVPPQALNDIECLAGVGLCAMHADGVISGDEDELLWERLLALPACADVDEAALREIIIQLDARGRRDGDDTLLAACAEELPARLRPTAYYLATEILSSDGEVAKEEHTFLKRAQGLLGVSDEDARRIAAVAAIRNTR